MGTTKTLKNESLFDVATREYGHVTGVFWLLEDNRLFGINQEFLGEETLVTRSEKVRLVPLSLIAFKKRKLSKYVLLPKQGFFDVLIENQGTIEAVFDLVDLNKYDGFTEHLFEADELEILATAASPRIKNSLDKYMPFTTITDADKSDGIGFMFIERNFKIR